MSNYPPGVTDNDPHFDNWDERGDEAPEPIHPAERHRAARELAKLWDERGDVIPVLEPITVRPVELDPTLWEEYERDQQSRP
jgi:hypothetical protein